MEPQEIKAPAVVQLNFHSMETGLAIEVLGKDGRVKVGSIGEIAGWLESLHYRYVTGTNAVWTTIPARHPGVVNNG